MTARHDHFQWGFSSLGAPELSLRELADLTKKFGLDFLELRAVRGTIALPDYFHDNPDDAAASCPVRVLSTDLRLAEATLHCIEKFMRFVELAASWKTPYVRVFGGGKWGEEITPAQLDHAVKTVVHCRELMTSRGLTCRMILETHSGFSSSETCCRLNKELEHPISILWDAHHTWKLAGEPMQDTWDKIGHWVRHIHYKDSVSTTGTEYKYVLPGQGEFPTAELIGLLHRVGYQGGVSLEWEKLWHPELAAIEEAVQPFAALAAS
jgi:sugar phosphate isomerase/epimerase